MKTKKKNELDFFKDRKLKKFENPIVSLFKEHLPKQIVLIAIMVIIIIFILLNLKNISNFINKVISILMPIIVGWVLAYLISPIYDRIVKYFTIRINSNSNIKLKLKKGLPKAIATIICLFIVIIIVVGLIFLFVPQLYDSITRFINKLDVYLSSAESFILNLKTNIDNPTINNFLDGLIKSLSNSVNQNSINNLDFGKFFVGIYNGFYVSFKVILNALVGLVVMIYSLNLKEELLIYCKRALFAIFEKEIARRLIEEFRFANKVFSGFLVGKIVDSFIIGVLCYICCMLMKMPYTPLVSVIVGVTNIIPFFGPFIGAVPSFIIIVLESPLKGIIFLIFVLVLQQVDGNIIGPKILGDRTGVGSFWVLFSIILFGGLFGFIGMIIAVPLWAVISRLFEEFVSFKLSEKGYPTTVEEYQLLKAKRNSIKKVVKKNKYV